MMTLKFSQSDTCFNRPKSSASCSWWWLWNIINVLKNHQQKRSFLHQILGLFRILWIIGGYNTAQQMKFSIEGFFIFCTVDWLTVITSLWFSILLILTLIGSLTYTVELINPQNNCELDISLIVVYTGRYLAQIKNLTCFYNM